ncbi:Ribonuclease P protein subunit p21, partial [Coemansia sp. RSA 2399]
MNFLYQSSRFFAHLSPQPTSSDSSSSPMLPAARFFAKEMRQVARKSVLRISPHIKREICKSCASPLVPGVSCTTRVKGHKKGRRVVTT